MEQSLYAQVVNLRRKDLKFVVTDKNKIEAKFKFQGRSVTKNFKSLRRRLMTCAYKLCSIAIRFIYFLPRVVYQVLRLNFLHSLIKLSGEILDSSIYLVS